MHIETILAVKGKEVSTIEPGARVGEAMQRMRRERIGALVISSDGASIHGIISDRGIMHAIADRGTEVLDQPIHTIMATQVVTCSPRDRVSSIMALMTERRIRHIPVVQEDGRLYGIVSIGDVVKHRLDEIQSEAEAMREYISGMH
jgi:CBS domain-containing protein